MIRSLKVANFYSINRSKVLNFTVDNKAPKSTSYRKSIMDDRCSTVNVLIGPNASGKTNLLKTFSFLRYFIVSSNTIELDEKILIDFFALKKKNKEVSYFLVEFETDQKIYKYELKVSSSRVLLEKLKVSTGSSGKRTIFRREWDNSLKKYSFVTKGYGINKKIQEAVRPNTSVISIAIQLNNVQLRPVYDYWREMVTNLHAGGRINYLDNNIISKSVEKAAKFFYENDDLKKWADSILSELDLGLSKIDIIAEKEEKSPEKKLNYYPFGVHKINGQSYLLPIFYESSGTQCLYALLNVILPALKKGSVVVLDEFDNDIHPHMIPLIFSLFTTRKINQQCAQLIVSTHSITLLRRLDKYQIFIAEKNQRGETDVWRLDDLGVRSDDNFLNKYETGAYGGKPNV